MYTSPALIKECVGTEASERFITPFGISSVYGKPESNLQTSILKLANTIRIISEGSKHGLYTSLMVTFSGLPQVSVQSYDMAQRFRLRS